MNPMPLILLNVALVAGGIVIYDQVRGDPPAPTWEVAGAGSETVADLKERIADLERARGTEPLLQADGPDPRLVARLEALEARVAVRPAAAPEEDAMDGGSDGGFEGFALPELAEGEELPAETVQKFRRLMEAAEQMRREERERERLLAALERIDVKLNDAQTDKLLNATREYRRKVGEVWRNSFREGRDQGLDRDVMRENARQGMEALQAEFAVTVNKFLPAADAQKVVENSNQLGVRGSAMFRGRRGR